MLRAPEAARLFVRARREDRRLRSKVASIRSELQAGARLAPDRRALLERLPKGAVAAEVGVAEGRFSELILEVARPGVLHLIDPWDLDVPAYSPARYELLRERLAAERDAGRVVLHRGYSVESLAGFEDGSLDWAYLDAAHDYASVKADLEALAPKVRPGGLIAGHDYVRWASATDRYGVVEAVNGFVNETGSRLIALTNEGGKHDSYAFQVAG